MTACSVGLAVEAAVQGVQCDKAHEDAQAFSWV